MSWDGLPSPQAVDWQSAGVSGSPGASASPMGSTKADVLLVCAVIGGLVVLALVVHMLNVKLD